MAFTVDQDIEIWGTVGTWLAGLGTFSAVVVSLYLASRNERVRLKALAGLRQVFSGDGSPSEENLIFAVTNLAERPVVIDGIGWRIGRGKNMRNALQTVAATWTNHYPIELAHAKRAEFAVSFSVNPTWLEEFAHGFVQDISRRNLKTLRAQIYTSVGQTVEIKPEPYLIERLKEAMRAPDTDEG